MVSAIPLGKVLVELPITRDREKGALSGKWQMVKGQPEYMSFFLTNLAQCRQRLGQFSQDSTKFVARF